MSWLYLLIASFFEIVWAVGLKQAYDLKLNFTTASVAVSMVLSLVFLSMAVQKIPMGIAYAIWTGVGIVGVFIYSFLINKEPISYSSILFVALILIGVVGLKLVTSK